MLASTRQPTTVLAAALLIVLALGLPWTSVSGASGSARVFLVGALVLIVVARLRQDARLLVVAGAGLALGILLVGLSVQGGQVAAAAAAVLLLHAGLSGAAAPARA